MKLKADILRLDFPIQDTPNAVEHEFSCNEKVKKYILGGNSIFTVQNSETKNRFTYNIKQGKKNQKLFWVSVLVGTDNMKDYKFIGCFSLEKGYLHSTSSKVTIKAQSVRVIDYYLRKLFNNTLPLNIRTFHLSYCGRCGKPLTTPDSIESGFGPTCIQAIGFQTKLLF